MVAIRRVPDGARAAQLALLATGGDPNRSGSQCGYHAAMVEQARRVAALSIMLERLPAVAKRVRRVYGLRLPRHLAVFCASGPAPTRRSAMRCGIWAGARWVCVTISPTTDSGWSAVMGWTRDCMAGFGEIRPSSSRWRWAAWMGCTMACGTTTPANCRRLSRTTTPAPKARRGLMAAPRC